MTNTEACLLQAGTETQSFFYFSFAHLRQYNHFACLPDKIVFNSSQAGVLKFTRHGCFIFSKHNGIFFRISYTFDLLLLRKCCFYDKI